MHMQQQMVTKANITTPAATAIPAMTAVARCVVPIFLDVWVPEDEPEDALEDELEYEPAVVVASGEDAPLLALPMGLEVPVAPAPPI